MDPSRADTDELADRFFATLLDGVQGVRDAPGVGCPRVGSLLIVNPHASEVSDALVERVVAELPAELEVVRTGGPGEATEIAREHEALRRGDLRPRRATARTTRC